MKLHLLLVLLATFCLQGMQEPVLITAIKAGDKTLVKNHIDSGFDVNVRDENDCSALEWAIKLHHNDIVKWFLNAKVQLEQPEDIRRVTSLHIAVDSRNKEAIKLLLNAGAQVLINKRTWWGDTPLHYIQAIDSRDEEIVTLLLSAQPNLAVRSNQGLTAIQHLLNEPTSKKTDLSQLLVKPSLLAGIYDNDRVDYDVDPILSAVIENNLGDLKKLLNKISSDSLWQSINSQDELGATRLMYAAVLGYEDIVNFLLEQGADPSMLTNNGKTVFNLIEDIVEAERMFPWIKEKKEEKIAAVEAKYVNILNACRVRLYNNVQQAMYNKLEKKGEVYKRYNIPDDIINTVIIPLMAHTAKARFMTVLFLRKKT